MTIPSLYAQNGNHVGFWIQHRSWRSVCAKVVSVAGQKSGHLAVPENSADVRMQYFDVGSGRPLAVGTPVDSPSDKGYVLIAEPPWHRRVFGDDAIPDEATPDA